MAVRDGAVAGVPDFVFAGGGGTALAAAEAEVMTMDAATFPIISSFFFLAFGLALNFNLFSNFQSAGFLFT